MSFLLTKPPEGELFLSIHGVLTWSVYSQQCRECKMIIRGQFASREDPLRRGLRNRQLEMGGIELGGWGCSGTWFKFGSKRMDLLFQMCWTICEGRAIAGPQDIASITTTLATRTSCPESKGVSCSTHFLPLCADVLPFGPWGGRAQYLQGNSCHGRGSSRIPGLPLQAQLAVEKTVKEGSLCLELSNTEESDSSLRCHGEEWWIGFFRVGQAGLSFFLISLLLNLSPVSIICPMPPLKPSLRQGLSL